MELIAHRGACFGAPENSLAAFELAIAQGADRIELDVRVSADGVPFVSHDESTGRTGDRDWVVDETRADNLRAVLLPNGETLPTLEAACECLRGRAAIDLEIKAAAGRDFERIVDLLDRSRLHEDALVTSFDETHLIAVRRAGFRGRTGLLVGSKSLAPRQRAYEAWPLRAMRRAGVTDLVTHHKLAHLLLRGVLRRAGLGLILWSAIEDELEPAPARTALYRRAAASGAKGLIVGRIAEARRVMTR